MYKLPAPGDSVKTTCAYCGVGCGIIATRNADDRVSVTGDPDHPANFGRLCSKGTSLGETLGLEGRLLYPEVNGQRHEWNSALQVVADGFSKTIAENGPDSVAFYVSGQLMTEDYYVANKLMKGWIGSANIDTNSRLCMASSVAGHRKAFGTDTVPGCYEDLELADLVILTGSNLAWCHPVTYQRLVAAKEARPQMQVILIDPRRTATAQIADIHLPIRPDGDNALFAGLLAYLAAEQVLDRDYIDAHTAGFDQAVAAASALSQDDIVEQTGLTAEGITTFYSLFATTEKTVTLYSQGVNQSSQGTDKVSAIINCHLATARIGKPGMGPFSITGQPNAMGGREVGGLANMLACHMNLENADHRDIVQRFWRSPKIAEKPGLKAVDLFKKVHSGEVKAVWIMATNPVVSVPEADLVAAALKKCPLVVVSDVFAQTDTAQYANIKLPAAGWAEKDGTVTNSERRISRQRAVQPLPGEAMPDWWIIAEVAKRMGYDHGFNWQAHYEVFAEFAAMSGFENGDSRDFDISALGQVTGPEFDDLKPFQWPWRIGEASGGRFFADGGFYNGDRKAKFIPVSASNTLRATEDRPFIMNTGRIRDHWHTMTRTGRTPTLNSHLAEPFVEIHPEDATVLGIQDAALAMVTTGLAKVIVRALITDRVMPGEVFVPMHWTAQFSGMGRVDALVPSMTDPFSGQPAFKNVPVSIAPVVSERHWFAVLPQKPSTVGLDYWSLAMVEGGYKIEAAGSAMQMKNWLVTNALTAPSDIISVRNPVAGTGAYARFANGIVTGICHFASQPVLASRTWVTSLLDQQIESLGHRFSALAPRPENGSAADKGAIVCACESVGLSQILAAIDGGADNVKAVGNCTRAGTNCGSCRPEIKALISTKEAEIEQAA